VVGDESNSLIYLNNYTHLSYLLYIILMRKTFKYRLYPNRSQVSKMNNILEQTRWVYNQTLALRKNAWESEKKSISLYETSNKLVEWKAIKPELESVQSQVLQNAQLRVDLAFKAFFRRCKAGENPGFPRFKGFNRYNSITYPQSGFRLHPDKTVYLSKIGRVPIILHRPTQGTIKICTVKRTPTNKWFVYFSCEVEKSEPLPKTGKITGIDLGLITYTQCSDGSKINKPRFFKEEQKSLAKAQRRFSKFSKETWNKEKQQAKLVVARIHERIKNKREDFCHKTSKKLINKYDFIAHEALDAKGMLEQKKWSKSIADAAWSTLIEFLTYKAENAGRIVVAVDPRGTSQRCSQCGTVVPKTIEIRTHNCPHCGFKTGRDLNSALEILRLGMQSVAA
jgi:putative transposase